MNTSYSNTSIQIGDIIYSAIEENVYLESAPWALERVDRVLKKLHEARNRGDQFKVVIPWLEKSTAFTAPGQYIFFARPLFQLCDCDDMAAMVIAHEMSHHDLGHTKAFPNWFKNVSNLDVKILTFALYRLIETRIYGPEQECDADRNGLEICIKAGYDGEKCIQLFDKLEKYMLDLGEIGAVFGPDDIDGTIPEDAAWGPKFRRWFHQRKRGYLPLRERREVLVKHFERMSSRKVFA